MFVAINNKDMNIHDVEKWINNTRDNNGGVISPEFAMEILSKTNHLGHIKKVLANIKKNCTTKEEIEPYREFILSCVDGREMSADALKMLQEMATLCGCEDEFKVANGKLKIYGKTDSRGIIVKSMDELEALEGENLTVFLDKKGSDYKHYDFSAVKKVKFKEALEVDLTGVAVFPEELDLSLCGKVNLSYLNLRRIKKINFMKGGRVNFGGSCNLPSILDLSTCSFVGLGYTDLSGVEEIKFRDGAEVYLEYATNLPKNLDLSPCGIVNLNRCDLSGVKELKFRDGAEVYLSGAKNLPKDLDVSMCFQVVLSECDLGGVEELKFGEWSVVNFYGAKNLPEVLDVSMCSQVFFDSCDMSGVKEVKFKDKAQAKKFMEGAENFKGKIVYEDGKEDNSLFSRISKRFGPGEMGE